MPPLQAHATVNKKVSKSHHHKKTRDAPPSTASDEVSLSDTSDITLYDVELAIATAVDWLPWFQEFPRAVQVFHPVSSHPLPDGQYPAIVTFVGTTPDLDGGTGSASDACASPQATAPRSTTQSRRPTSSRL